MFVPDPSSAATRSRLLPADVPFRFFAAAIIYDLFGWLALAIVGDAVIYFAGGLGPVVATLHLFTLGVLAMTLVGASLQLLPIATVQPVRSVRVARLIWWMLVLGVLVLVAGMASAAAMMLLAGGGAVVAALALYAWLLAANLIASARARATISGLVVHARGAWLALVVVLVTATMLIAHHALGIPLFSELGRMHGVVALFGFVGLAALGFSYLLIPLFGVVRPPPPQTQIVIFSILAFSLGLYFAGVLGDLTTLKAVAAQLAMIGVVAHVIALERSLAVSKRRRREPFLILWRSAWIALVAGLIAATLAASGIGPPIPIIRPALVVVLALGWLVTMTVAMLVRIIPFLASVHAPRVGGRPRLASSLTARRPLAATVAGQVIGLALVIVGILTESDVWLRVGAAAGVIGAGALGAYFLHAARVVFGRDEDRSA